MKFCFYLQRRFAYIGHSMIKQLDARYQNLEFCGFVEVKTGYDFLQKQTDISYTRLVLEEELHERYKNEAIDLNFLKELESNYGIPFLWPYIELDRVIRFNQLVREYPYNTPKYTHEEMLRILQVSAREVLSFLECERPNVLVFSVVTGLTSYLLYTLAKAKGVPVYVINLARVKNRFTVSSDFRTLTTVDDFFKKIINGQADFPEGRAMAESFLTEFRQHPAPYSSTVSPKNRPVNRRRQLKFLLPWNAVKSLHWLFKMTWNYCFGNYKEHYTTIKPWYFLWDKIKQKARMVVGYGDIYGDIDLNENIVFFPLQVEPEISTSLYAPYYTDQLWVAKQIAKSLPVDFKLCIKEHPAMYGKRPIQFYQELKKIPNARLVRPDVMSFDLIRQAKLLVVITSTVGWEGYLLGKPVIVFGDVFYSNFPGIIKCAMISELPFLIKKQLAASVPDQEFLINYLTAIYRESVDVDLPQIWDVEGTGTLEARTHELVPLVDLLAEKIGLERAV